MGEVIQLQPCDPVPSSFELVLSGNGNGICCQKTEEEEYISGINKLSYLCKTLEEMDRVESRQQVSQKKLHLVLDIDHTLGSCRDVRTLAATLRSSVLTGCRLYMKNVKDQELWKMAKELGATCCNQLNLSVTHLVSCEKGSADFDWGVKKKKFLVDEEWIREAYYLWLRPSEEENS
ncbi:hypothetical protein COLO4_00079 [Corchorus olitorius]|uniref:protein-serine/threonine phosphatase n=1 Tax=Corchorus olitorius TaxID=93759 RepID=A0A1R3L4Q9_9ROSI|nr:hypothetical protein COLO4_00079 [Corchorus olitorius]